MQTQILKLNFEEIKDTIQMLKNKKVLEKDNTSTQNQLKY